MADRLDGNSSLPLARIAGRSYGSTTPELDRRLYLGHRRRCAPRPLRPRQVPRCHPADDRPAAPGRGAGADQAGRARHEDLARQCRRRQPGHCPAPGIGPRLLQHLEVHPARPARPRQPAAVARRLRGLPRRLLTKRAGDPRQLRVPKPDPAPLEGRCAGHPHREVPFAGPQRQPEPGSQRRRLAEAPRPR